MRYDIEVLCGWYQDTITDDDGNMREVDRWNGSQAPRILADYTPIAMSDITAQPATNLIPAPNLLLVRCIVDNDTAVAIENDVRYFVQVCEPLGSEPSEGPELAGGVLQKTPTIKRRNDKPNKAEVMALQAFLAKAGVKPADVASAAKEGSAREAITLAVVAVCQAATKAEKPTKPEEPEKPEPRETAAWISLDDPPLDRDVKACALEAEGLPLSATEDEFLDAQEKRVAAAMEKQKPRKAPASGSSRQAKAAPKKKRGRA